MLVQGIDSTLIFVTDVGRSVAWYRDVLGLQVRMAMDGFAVLEAGGHAIALHAGLDLPEGGAAERPPMTMPVLRVADYAAAKATLEERGCVFSFENQTPHAIFGSFADPDGNPLQIIERRPR